ncbi:hypothetical protein BS50DRAFT_39007 [Corynespora cassiicola Philippines]|uniref:Uncharacterized protein n=1 Tax=Corynespora cassiicola Philippines TaxID=1448308 RepID=A0A2T2PCM5_CORCC|nr:hypothetical protein BS50DRAFT_39007 [Corynespora cassiicola Philippines]
MCMLKVHLYMKRCVPNSNLSPERILHCNIWWRRLDLASLTMWPWYFDDSSSPPSTKQSNRTSSKKSAVIRSEITNSIRQSAIDRKNRAISKAGGEPNTFFSQLDYDVRVQVYELMALRPVGSGEEWMGLYLSCHQAKDEMDLAAARDLWLLLHELKARAERLGTLSWKLHHEIKSKEDLLGVRQLIVYLDADKIWQRPVRLFYSSRELVDRLAGLYLDNVTFHVTGDMPKDISSKLDRRGPLQQYRFLLYRTATENLSSYCVLHAKEVSFSWDLAGGALPRMMSTVSGLTIGTHNLCNDFFCQNDSTLSTYTEKVTDDQKVGLISLRCFRHCTPHVPLTHMFFITTFRAGGLVCEIHPHAVLSDVRRIFGSD